MLVLSMGGYSSSAYVIKVRGHRFCGSSWVQPPCGIRYSIRPWGRVIGGKDRLNEILFLGWGNMRPHLDLGFVLVEVGCPLRVMLDWGFEPKLSCGEHGRREVEVCLALFSFTVKDRPIACRKLCAGSWLAIAATRGHWYLGRGCGWFHLCFW